MRRTSALITALMISAALTACGPGLNPEVDSADPSVAEPTSSGPDASVDPSPEVSGEPTSAPGVSEDPSLPAPVLTGWDPNLVEFGGTPPPVVFTSLFDGQLPAADPKEVGGFTHVVHERARDFWRLKIYQEQQDRGASYDLEIEVNSLKGYAAFVSEGKDIEQVGFATCTKVPHHVCAVVADDGVITLGYAGDPSPELEEMVAELGKLVEFYAND